MVEETLVDESRELAEAVRGVVSKLNSTKGPLYLAALVQFANQVTDKWVFLAGSHRLFKDIYNETRGLIELIDQSLPCEYRTRIIKVGIISPTDPFFRALAKTLRLADQPGLVRIQDCQIHDINVHNAWIFMSSPVAANGQEPRKRRIRSAKTTRPKRR